MSKDRNKSIALYQEHREAFRFWKTHGLFEKNIDPVTGRKKRKHGAPAHMLVGAHAIKEIGTELVQNGHMTPQDVNEAVKAYLVHDASKSFEFPIVKNTSEGDYPWNEIEKYVIKNSKIPQPKKLMKQLDLVKEIYEKQDTTLGERTHLVRSEVAGAVHKNRLRRAGFTSRVIKLQGGTEYTGSESAEDMINEYKMTKSKRKKSRLLGNLLVHMADNSMMNDTFTTAAERTHVVFKKPINKDLSESYRRYTKNGESAEEIQTRVGTRVESFLSEILEIDASEFVSFTNRLINRKLR